MSYTITEVAQTAELLKTTFDTLINKRDILRAPEIKALFAKIKDAPPQTRNQFGAEVNALKTEIEAWVAVASVKTDNRQSIDITAPFGVNTSLNDRPNTFLAARGSVHPLMGELDTILDIYYRMGFTALESRQIDDDFHMFESLNFPKDHPARDDYDTFMTTDGYIAPAHTSTMQHRALLQYKDNLAKGEPIAVVIPGRVFRNEDLDVTHEHAFFQLEGIYVDKNINVGNLIAVLRSFMSEYYGEDLKAKIQPFYFPFTEPSFEFAIERPEILRNGTTEADMWLELLGCGMINPNVLTMAGIDPNKYTGFAWGGGLERLVMMKYGIEDIRLFSNGKLEFLRQF